MTLNHLPSYFVIPSNTNHTTMKKRLLLLLFIPFVGALSASAQGQCTAMYQFTLGNCPNIMFFDGSTAGSPMATIVEWDWDFDDGSSSTQQNPTHVYTSNGNYTVCLTITDSDSCVSTICNDVLVSCLTAPACDAAFQYTLCPDVMFFDGSTTTTGTIVEWDWDFGDGGSSTIEDPTHLYAADGGYEVCLTIATSDSCVSTYCDSVAINCNASIGELNLNDLILSPNPAQNMITLELNSASKIEFQILSLNGSVQLSGTRSALGKHTFDINTLAPGVYLLEIEIDGLTGAKRFVKE